MLDNFGLLSYICGLFRNTMEHQDIALKDYAKNYGFIYGGYSILVLLLLYLFNYEQNTGIALLNFIINTAIVFLAINRYKSDNEGHLGLTQAIKLGLAIGAIGGLIYAIYMYVHYTYLQPDFIVTLKEGLKTSVEAEIERQNLTGEEAETTREISTVFATPFFMATSALISILLKTLFVSLVVGLIKKN